MVKLWHFLNHWSAVLHWAFQVADLSQKSTLMVPHLLSCLLPQAWFLLPSLPPFLLSLLLQPLPLLALFLLLLLSASLQPPLFFPFVAFHMDDS
jgi:hypothetical protein